MRRRPRAIALRFLSIGAVLSTVLVGSVLTAGPAAAASVTDPERAVTTPTAWVMRTSATAAQLNSAVSSGYRITSLQVSSTTGPRFHATLVRNTGTYQRAWWWFYGLTAAQVSSKLSTLGARIVELEPYVTGGSLRFAVVMVRNSGTAAKQWWWLRGTSSAGISALAASKGARPIDLDRTVLPGGSAYYTAVFVKNSGVDARPWYHAYNLTTAQVVSYGSARSATPLSIQPRGVGRFDVLYAGGGPARTTMLELSPTAALAQANQEGRRVVQVVPSAVPGLVQALSLDNLDAESLRLRNLVRSGMSGASYGWYVKRVGGGIATSLQADQPFEPASTMKAVHLLRAVREIAPAGGLTLASTGTWYVRPGDAARYPTDPGYDDDKNRCAYTTGGSAVTSVPYVDNYQTLMNQMMQYSDNRATDFFVRRYGFPSLNALMSSLGMSNSVIRHRIGCGDTWLPSYHAVRNQLTSRDLGKLYESVVAGTSVNATGRSMFFGRMNGGVLGDGDLKAMIVSELTAAGLTGAQRSQFLARVTTRSKGGSYGLCPNSGPCDGPTRQIRTVGGVIWLPFKSGATTTDTAFVYSQWFDKTVPCTFANVSAGSCTSYNTTATANGTLSIQRFRSIVRAAAATW